MGLLAKITLYHTNNRKMLFIVDKTGLFDSNTNTGGGIMAAIRVATPN